MILDSNEIAHLLMELWSDQKPAAVVINMEIIMQMYPPPPPCRKESECSFLPGTFLEQVDREVGCKQKELLVSTLKGV